MNNPPIDLEVPPLTLANGQVVHVRPFAYTDADYEGTVAIDNAILPDHPASVEDRRYQDKARDPDRLFVPMVAHTDDQIVAHAIYMKPPWLAGDDKVFIDVRVHPDQQQQGIGGWLYNIIMDQLEPLQPKLLLAITREDLTETTAFLEKRGFTLKMREQRSRLDLTTFDPAPFQDYLDRVSSARIAITTAQNLLANDPDAERKLYELDWKAFQDVPSPEPLDRLPFEEWRKRLLGSPSFLPDAWFIALDGDDYVGLTNMWKDSSNPARLYTGLTGVVRSHRRRGIAVALKVHALNAAKQKGVEYTETENEENNPMYQLNVRLGFKPLPAWVEYHKSLR
jgi:GNAT superfamily N-acetyltransferase